MDRSTPALRQYEMAPRKPVKRKKKAAPRAVARKAAPAAPWWRRALRASLRLTLAGVVAAAAGGALVGLGMYRVALDDVRTRLDGAIWELPGHVWSGPVQVWPGLNLTPAELGADLKGAGYAEVTAPSGPGEFKVGSGSVLVHNAARSGPGWEVRAGEVLVTFRDGRVSSVSPSDPAVFPATELASIRGADNEERTPRELEDFPSSLRDGVLAMEDAHFFEHPGVSALGIGRALFVNLVTGERVQGGSTLTQQLAKNLFLSQERTFTRKGNELLLAFALERELSKEEILALYLNEIYWGQAGGVAICGADEAAQAYFGKSADRLTLGESATLAGIISSPNSYSPLRHAERATERRDLALDRMVAEGFIGLEEATAAKAQPLEVSPTLGSRKAPYVVDAAVDGAEEALGQGAVSEQALELHTLINPALQRLAEAVVAESMTKLDAAYPQAKGAQVALAAVRVSDGAVVALVGGRDYGESQFNRALLAERSPGSTVKPLTMLVAFEEDPSLGPASPLMDEAIERDVDGTTWRPTNYDGQYEGEVSVRHAIAHSRNIPAVLLAERVGYPDLQRFYQSVGLAGATRLPSSSLGAFEATPMELAGAYTVFPGGGVASEPRLLRAVTDSDGVLLVNDETISMRRSGARAAFLATSVLQSVMSEGTGSRASTFGATGALGGKTGTTDDYRDAWFVGFSAELSVAVWVGFDQGGSIGLSGSRAALPTWSRFMAGSGTSSHPLPGAPGGVVEAATCFGGFELGECVECGTEWYTDGFEPQDGCSQDPLQAIFDGLFGPRVQLPTELPEEAPRRRLPRFWPF